MKYFNFGITFLLLINLSCTKSNPKTFNFYHWKTKAKYSPVFEQALDAGHSQTIFMHYFDVEQLNAQSWYDNSIYPTYVLNGVDDAFMNYHIVPVVYITNSIFKSNVKIENLATKVTKLIHQISAQQFGKQLDTIQIDCDWTTSTQTAYFSFLQQLNQSFSINATIRLHQIKYQDKTGIPPVSKGTLMLYNMGDLKNLTQNSILDHNIVEQYINKESSYPIPLDVALPLFSQTVIKNNNNQIKIIKDSQKKALQNPNYFQRISETQFKVIKDTLFNGFYLSPGFSLKLEETNTDEIIDSYQIIQSSKLQTDQILFYHLDSASLQNIDIKTLTNIL